MGGHMRFDLMAIAALLTLTGTEALAQGQRYVVEGNRLFYNSLIPYEGGSEKDVVDRDADELALYLMEYPDIDTVVLESDGGSGDAARTMGDKIHSLGLATEVRAGCYSACPYIFLGGYPRTLLRGGVLGFHRAHTTPELLKDFQPDAALVGSTAYDQGIVTAVDVAKYMARRGVSDEFILALFAVPPREDWVPARAELIEAGVINE